MEREQHVDALTCSVCGAPRLAAAWDCAKCGAVFDDLRRPDAEGVPVTDGEAPSVETGQTNRRIGGATTAPRSSSARRPGSARRRPSASVAGGGLVALREWVADNKTVVVIVSFLVYIGVVWLFGALILGGTDAPGAVKNAYRDVTGRPLPEGFGPAFAAHFVSRRLVVLDRPDQVLLVLYVDADINDDSELHLFAERVLDVLEVPWDPVTTRTATVDGRSVEVPVLRLVGEGGPHVYLVPTATAGGGRAVEAVIGAPAAVLDVVEEMVRRR